MQYVSESRACADKIRHRKWTVKAFCKILNRVSFGGVSNKHENQQCNQHVRLPTCKKKDPCLLQFLPRFKVLRRRLLNNKITKLAFHLGRDACVAGGLGRSGVRADFCHGNMFVFHAP